jgi:hypothetical protein
MASPPKLSRGKGTLTINVLRRGVEIEVGRIRETGVNREVARKGEMVTRQSHATVVARWVIVEVMTNAERSHKSASSVTKLVICPSVVGQR